MRKTRQYVKINKNIVPNEYSHCIHLKKSGECDYIMGKRLLSDAEVLSCASILSDLYPTARPMLEFTNNFELLIAVILSAQCRDERVNSVTQKLFLTANTPQKILDMGETELSQIIKPCGLFKNKASNIIKASRDLIEKFDGQVPSKFEDLITLPGVGRKTANVVLNVGFGTPAIAVDTHVFRVANRLGLANGKTPLDVENRLMKIFDCEIWGKMHHCLIFHGRQVCRSQNPNCQICTLNGICSYYANLKSEAKQNKNNKSGY